MTEKTDWETDFLEMHSKGTRGKLQEKEIQLDVRKKKCAMRVTKHRNRSTARCNHHLHAQNPNPEQPDLAWKLVLL